MLNTQVKMAFFMLALCITCDPAGAGQLEVSPVTLDMPNGTASTVLTVVNRGTERTGIQVRGFTWSQSTRDDQLSPTRDLLISPPIAELNPGETQTVRILLREPARRIEASYRVLVDEIPAAGSPSTVRLSLRLSLPLFAGPAERTAPDLQWQVVNGPAKLELHAMNRGTRRERVTELAVAAAGLGTIKAQLLPNTWVLPGAERHWTLPVRGEIRSAQVQVTGNSDSGPVNAVLPILRAP